MFISKLLGKQDVIKTSASQVAVGGYDPVAYVTQGMPVKGKPEHHHTWQGVTWKFSSDDHRELFMNNPEKFVPQYGGYCAFGIAHEKFFDGDPQVWSVIDEKLYLLGNSEIAEKWRKDFPGNIKKANQNWPKLIA